jgi:hypothetical protein
VEYAAMDILLRYLLLFRPDPRIFFGFWILLLLPGFLVVTTWTSIRVWVFCARLRRERRKAQERAYLPDGRPRPPRGQGICGKCQRAFDDVYYLPSGEKLCPDVTECRTIRREHARYPAPPKSERG